jgi:hypothetical protein
LVNKVRRFAVTLGLAASLAMVALAPEAQVASAAYQLMWHGETVLIAYPDSPLRSCPSKSCRVYVFMPPSTGTGLGQGWAPPWGTVGWTGCWRLAPVRN